MVEPSRCLRVCAILREIVSGPTKTEAPSLREWWTEVAPRLNAAEDPAVAACLGGALADRLGYAFAAGYHAALRALVPALSPDLVVALCATETEGVHPTAIKSTLAMDSAGDFRLTGRKTFATLAGQADELLVVASTDRAPSGRNHLRLARVPATREGVSITSLPTTPFAPEVPHAAVDFYDVVVHADELLAGDGYADYLKPFRTTEDLHVHLALLGYLAGVARRCAWPASAFERITALLVLAAALCGEPVSAPETHLILAGLIAQCRTLVVDLEPHWSAVTEEERNRWHRDEPLLRVAERAREARRERAWAELSGLSPV